MEINRKILNETEYNAICARIEELMEIVDENTLLNDKDAVELSLLSDLVVAYEKEHFPVTPPTLVEVLKLRMFEMNLTQRSLADLLGISAPRVNQYLSGKSEPTLPVARKISQELNIDANIVLGV